MDQIIRHFVVRRAFIFFAFLFASVILRGQSHNYWTRSFNEESSLLSGAVVGGGSGPSAIYYNPGSISEVKASKFSLNASLFSFNFLNMSNALGKDIDIETIITKVEPRFISYMFKSKKLRNWSFEIAFLNNENERADITTFVNEQNHILTSTPGTDRYTAYYQYYTQFRDDWIGLGTSVRINKRIALGVSMFASIKSLNYKNLLDIQAYPFDDSIPSGSNKGSFFVAGYENNYYLKFNDYRLLWKVGLIYELESLSLGITVTTPSVGVYSDGKKVERKQQQSNITNPETGAPIPDYLYYDYQENKNVSVSFLTPLSIAAGMTWASRDLRRILYLSLEYFTGISPYKMVEAKENQFLVSDDPESNSEWLTYVSGAKPVFNIALGYSWTLNDKLLLKTGFRTDFNYQKNLDYGQYSEYTKIQKSNLNRYYLTCGLSWMFFGQNIITGIQYTHGSETGQKQLANFSDPVEYNFTEQKPLQGTRTNEMYTTLNSFLLYLGFSLNFGEKKSTEETLKK